MLDEHSGAGGERADIELKQLRVDISARDREATDRRDHRAARRIDVIGQLHRNRLRGDGHVDRSASDRQSGHGGADAGGKDLHGIADPQGYTGEFADKPGVFTVAPGASRTVGMAVTLIG